MSYQDTSTTAAAAPRNYGTSNRIEDTQRQVNEVVDIMRTNVNKVLERGEKLDDLGERAESLEIGANQFQTSAQRIKRKMWWENAKMWIIIGIIVAIILAIIIIWVVSSN